MATTRLTVVVGSAPRITLLLQADVIQSDAPNNRSLVRAYLVAQVPSAGSWYGYHDGVVTGNVGGNSFSVTGYDADVAQGSYGWTRGPWDFWIQHNADGTLNMYLGLSVNYPHLTGGTGSTSGSMWLPTLTVPPGTPWGATLVRNSDSQATASWNRNEPGNGQATSFDAYRSTNSGAWSAIGNIPPTSQLTFAVGTNQKIEAQVRAINAAGSSGWAQTNPVWTTPAAPSNVAAQKQPDNSIVVSLASNVGYSEHEHLIEHGVMTGSTKTWDGTVLATLPAGTTSYKHASPPPQSIHIYRVWARTTDVSHLESAKVESGSVQLIAPPNTPTIATLPQWSDPSIALRIDWTHNPVDTTAQTKAQLSYSANNGATWNDQSPLVNAYQYALVGPLGSSYLGQTLLFRVRTWGAATTGGGDGAGSSPWSATVKTSFASPPVGTILSPIGTVTQATLVVAVGFAQAQGATAVRARIELRSGAQLLETRDTTTLPATTMATKLLDGHTYTVTVTVTDSHGLTSTPVTSTITVDYTDPVPAGVKAVYLPEQGTAMLTLTIPPAGPAQAAAVAVTVTRSINGVAEQLGEKLPAASSMSLLDATPTINGTNLYTVTTWSIDGAATSVTYQLDTREKRWVFLASGDDYTDMIRVYGNLSLGASPSLDQALFRAEGRPRPIALWGTTVTDETTVTATIDPTEGSTVDQVRQFLRTAHRVCYRDPTGARIFGQVKGQIQNRTAAKADLSLTITEAD